MKIEIKENSITLDGVEYIKKGQTPKDGEVWYAKSPNFDWLFISGGTRNHLTKYVAALCLFNYDVWFDNSGYICVDDKIKLLRPATPEEIELLHSKLAENSKKWNAETKTLEDLPKPLKEGDLAIFWDYDKRCAVIGVYKKSITVSFSSLFTHLRMGGVQYINAIPFESIEQYKQFVK